MANPFVVRHVYDITTLRSRGSFQRFRPWIVSGLFHRGDRTFALPTIRPLRHVIGGNGVKPFYALSDKVSIADTFRSDDTAIRLNGEH